MVVKNLDEGIAKMYQSVMEPSVPYEIAELALKSPSVALRLAEMIEGAYLRGFEDGKDTAVSRWHTSTPPRGSSAP